MDEEGFEALQRGETPMSQTELRQALADKSAAVLGCGGLGSNCAAMLVRSGVLTLTLVDFDTVEPENLNRQLFFAEDIGQPKVEALARTLHRIEPDARLRLVRDCIVEGNVLDIVAGADVIIEAVDDAETKALILRVCACELPHVPLVSASGLAGHGSANAIETFQLADNLWMVGDLESDVRDGHALVASRVTLAAAHEAHAAIRLLLGLPGA